MAIWKKITGFTVGMATLAAILPLVHAAVGNIDDTPGVERVSVGPVTIPL